MNTQLEQLLKEAQYYTPSKTVFLAASGNPGDEKTIKFTGLNTRKYGVNRFLPGGPGLQQVTATVSFNNGRDTKLEDIHLACLQTLFQQRSLRGSFNIDDSTEMYVTLKNNGTTPNVANFEIVGYDKAHLQQKMDQYEDRNCKFPEPEFVYLPNTTISAGTTNKRFQISIPSYKLRLYRIAVFSENYNPDLLISIRQGQVRIKPEVFWQQINDEFRSMDIILPITLQANTPFDVFITNNSATDDHQFSMLAECYKI